MTPPSGSPPRSVLRPMALIAGVVAFSAGAFALTAGWFSSSRLTPNLMIQALTPTSGPALGHRRNHAKGVCFTGVFEANGAGSALSRAAVFEPGQYPVLGRFNLGTADPGAADATVRVRGMGLRITSTDGQEWRMAMINPPFFPVATPQGFYELLRASGSKQPDAMKDFSAAHPEFSSFVTWAKSAPWTGSYAEESFHSLDSFVFADRRGSEQTVRWTLLPTERLVTVSPEDLAKRGPDYLQQEIAERVRGKQVRRTMVVTVASPSDPTADPSKPWPQDRRTVMVGTLIVEHVEAEADGPCRDINFDPTVLPSGISTSNDPFPAARSAAYRVSYDLRTAESQDYPRTATGNTR
jgi:catalase